MKNYLPKESKKEESKTFILDYEIKGDKIIITFADKKQYTIPYTKQNEAKILNKMENQVYESVDYEEIQAIKLFRAILFEVFISLLTAFLIFAALAPKGICSPLLFVICAVNLIYGAIDIAICKKNLNDVKKSSYFMEEKEHINKNVKSNENVLSNVKEKTKEVVNSSNELTINNSRKIELKELKKIVENIKRDEFFGFDYSESSKDEEDKKYLKK